MEYNNKCKENGLNEVYLDNIGEQPFLRNNNLSSLDSVILHNFPKSPQQIQSELEIGVDFPYLLSNYPESMLKAIRDLSIKKIGDFELSDTIVLNAFGNNSLMTRGSDTMEDENYKETWKNLIEKEAIKNNNHIESGWKHMITICVYVICIRDIAHIQDKGLLHPLMIKAKASNLIKEIFSLPVIQALVDFKWRYMARIFVIIEFFIYLFWVLTYIIFVALFTELDDVIFKMSQEEAVLDKIEEDNRSRYDLPDLDFIKENQVRYAWGCLFLFMSLIAMIPFIVLEINSIFVYKQGWVSMWNIFSVITIFNQFMLTGLYTAKYGIERGWYSILLATHSITLFTKIQYFARCFSSGSAFIEVLCEVISHVRWFLIFILYSIFSATLIFMNLYRLEDSEDYENFDGFFKTFVTMFGFLIGNFKYYMLFDTKLPLLTSVVFIGFQVYLAILLLNLLIGVMTESYIKILKYDFITFTKSRAMAVDEIEATFARGCLKPKLKLDSFIHFALIKQKQHIKNYDTCNDSDVSTKLMVNEIDDEIAPIKEEIQNLSQKIYNLSQLKQNKKEITL